MKAIVHFLLVSSLLGACSCRGGPSLDAKPGTQPASPSGATRDSGTQPNETESTSADEHRTGFSGTERVPPGGPVSPQPNLQPTNLQPSSTAAAAPATIYLQPLGSAVPRADMSEIADTLMLFYHVKVEILDPRPLPPEAYFAPRQRYRAEKLLGFLEELTPTDARAIVGLTASDISTTKGEYADWGVLGLATVGGRQCVISSFRAKRGASGADHARERLTKTVVHEVGHAFGLAHCPNFGCLMEDGQGTVQTTDHEIDLCEECRLELGPWAKPAQPGAAVSPAGWQLRHEDSRLQPELFDGHIDSFTRAAKAK